MSTLCRQERRPRSVTKSVLYEAALPIIGRDYEFASTLDGGLVHPREQVTPWRSLHLLGKARCVSSDQQPCGRQRDGEMAVSSLQSIGASHWIIRQNKLVAAGISVEGKPGHAGHERERSLFEDEAGKVRQNLPGDVIFVDGADVFVEGGWIVWPLKLLIPSRRAPQGCEIVLVADGSIGIEVRRRSVH